MEEGIYIWKKDFGLWTKLRAVQCLALCHSHNSMNKITSYFDNQNNIFLF